MRDRAQAYRDRCRSDGRQDIIAHCGIKRIGDVRYGDDGMLYIGRKKHGPYLTEVRYGGDTAVVRHGEQANIHRFEQFRWDLLLRLKKLYEVRSETIAALKKVAVRKRAIGLFNHQWIELHFVDGSIEKKILEVSEENLLDAMVKFGRSEEEHRLVARFLRTEVWIEKRWVEVGRANGLLQHLFRQLNPDKTQIGRYSPVSVVVNGRNYIAGRGHYPPDSPDASWPSPMLHHINLDEPAIPHAQDAAHIQG